MGNQSGENMWKRLAFTGLAYVAAVSAGAIEWSMLIEVDGTTNKITSAGKRYAIDVSLVERDGAWSGSVANREKGTIVLGLELTAEPLAVTPGRKARIRGRRRRRACSCRSRASGTPREEAVPCRCRIPPSSPRCSGLRSTKGRAGSILPRRILWRARRISRLNTIRTTRD